MKNRFKAYFKLNLISMFLIAVSFISVTLAWFAYSGLARVTTEVNVKAWNIELEKDGQKVTNDIVISLSEIYPGMDHVHELLKIKNLGDSNATIKFNVSSVRILDEHHYDVQTDMTTEEIEDLIAYEFPFSINMMLNKNYALSKGDESYFEVSVFWPLDSDNDELDSYWGNKAYEFQLAEETKLASDDNYQIRPSIQIVISLTAEQYIEEDTSTDPRYDLGQEILYDVIEDKRCHSISSTCIKTYVIDINNTLGDDHVSLLLNPYNSFLNSVYDEYDQNLLSLTQDWQVNYRPLEIKDIMKIIAKDIKSSMLIREGLSESLIGGLKTENRMNLEIDKAIGYNGYYRFNNKYFDFTSSVDCYWSNTPYDLEKSFAVKKVDEEHSIIYGEDKDTLCKVIPILEVPKVNL